VPSVRSHHLAEFKLIIDWKNAPDSPEVNAVSTGNYGLLAAELCRLTKEDKYCETAKISAQWLDNHMVNPEGILMDHYNGKNCELKDWLLTCEQNHEYLVKC
jgi:predicted alpha-1,6-mannanase (GH76 family)